MIQGPDDEPWDVQLKLREEAERTIDEADVRRGKVQLVSGGQPTECGRSAAGAVRALRAAHRHVLASYTDPTDDEIAAAEAAVEEASAFRDEFIQAASRLPQQAEQLFSDRNQARERLQSTRVGRSRTR